MAAPAATIPVLVDRARMPSSHELPPALQPLARRQAIVSAILAAALAKVVAREASFYKLAGLAGGLLGGILAQQFLHDPGASRSLNMVLGEAVVMVAALAAVATTLPAAAPRRTRVLTRT